VNTKTENMICKGRMRNGTAFSRFSPHCAIPAVCTFRLWFLSLLATAALGLTAFSQARLPEREITFGAEDGWTISGMLSVPEGQANRAPGVLFLHSYEHDRDAYGQYLYPGLAQIIGARQVATLRIDFRGRGRSAGAKKLHMFSDEELANLRLDVSAALKFLAMQPGVDPDRLGIVAEGMSAEAAVMGWGGNPGVKAMVLLSPRLSDAAKTQIAKHPDLPLSLVVSKEDRESFYDTAAAYKLSRSAESRIGVYKDIGMGTTMFSVWRSEKPKEKPLEDGLAEWMVALLAGWGETREVSFASEDGWTLHGTLKTPAGMSAQKVVPGVVMIHSSFTDRNIWNHLADAIVRQGLAVLSFDTRGRGQSTGKGDLLALSPEERNNTSLDARAAVRFLVSQPGIGRVGVMGADRGATYALAAALESDRAGAAVLMTTLVNAVEREAIAARDLPVFFLTSQTLETATNGSMAAAYAATKNRGSRLLVYPGGALGYDLLEFDHSLESALAMWLKEQLSR
jgi:dienelactone hydrolase